LPLLPASAGPESPAKIRLANKNFFNILISPFATECSVTGIALDACCAELSLVLACCGLFAAALPDQAISIFAFVPVNTHAIAAVLPGLSTFRDKTILAADIHRADCILRGRLRTSD
jgi:hypothetical protein